MPEKSHGAQTTCSFFCARLFAFDPIRQAVLLCGGDKTSNKRFYEVMIPIAEQEFLLHLSAIHS